MNTLNSGELRFPSKGGNIQATLATLFIVALSLSIYVVARTHTGNAHTHAIFYDSPFYMSMAKDGIIFNGNILDKQNAAFLPGYALLLAPAAHLLPGNPWLAALLTSTLLTLIGTFYLYKILDEDFGWVVAIASLLLLLLSPFALYFYNGYSGSALFACGVLAVFLLRKGNYRLAAFVAGYAVLCRPHGIIFVLLVPFVLALRFNKNQLLKKTIDCAFWGMIPALVYCIYVYVNYKDTTLYINALQAWRLGNFTDHTQGVIGSMKFIVWSYGHGLIKQELMAGFLYALFISIYSLYSADVLPIDFKFMLVGFLIFEIFATHYNPSNVGRHVAFMFPCSIAIAAKAWWRDSDTKGTTYLTMARAGYVLLLITSAAWYYVDVLRYFRVEWVS